jgi:hypothetical protein
MNNSIATVSVNSLEDSKTLVKCLKKSKLDSVATIPTQNSSLSDPNKRFSSPKYLGEWRHIEDCQSFFKKYNKSNNYAELNLGDYVKIFSRDEDHTYEWMIAGFDYYEDSFGPGIVFIPIINIGGGIMNSIDFTKGGYYGSDMHVYLMDLIDGEYNVVSKNIVTDAEPLIMLMSDIQVYGKSAEFNRLEELEAIYKSDTKYDKEILPVFKYIDPFEYLEQIPADKKYKYPWFQYFWLRAVVSSATFACAGNFSDTYPGFASGSSGLRPLIYLR